MEKRGGKWYLEEAWKVTSEKRQKVNKRPSRRRRCKGRLADCGWGQPARGAADPRKAGSAPVQQVAHTPTWENRARRANGGGRWAGVVGPEMEQTTAEQTPALGRFSATPHAGRGSASGWRRCPGEGLGFLSAAASNVSRLLGTKPRGVPPPPTATHPRRSRPERPGGAPAARP